MQTDAEPTEPITFRLDVGKKQAIERAAAIQGRSLSDFAAAALYRAARKVLSETDPVLVLSDRDRDAFLDALDHPAPPNPRLSRAAERYAGARSDGVLD